MTNDWEAHAKNVIQMNIIGCFASSSETKKLVDYFFKPCVLF
jgi:hypothetical protein